MQPVLLLSEDETQRYEHRANNNDDDKDLARAIEKARKEINTDVVIGDDGDDLYDICFIYKCPHDQTYCNDRSQTVCEECGEELGR